MIGKDVRLRRKDASTILDVLCIGLASGKR